MRTWSGRRHTIRSFISYSLSLCTANRGERHELRASSVREPCVHVVHVRNSNKRVCLAATWLRECTSPHVCVCRSLNKKVLQHFYSRPCTSSANVEHWHMESKRKQALDSTLPTHFLYMVHFKCATFVFFFFQFIHSFIRLVFCVPLSRLASISVHRLIDTFRITISTVHKSNNNKKVNRTTTFDVCEKNHLIYLFILDIRTYLSDSGDVVWTVYTQTLCVSSSLRSRRICVRCIVRMGVCVCVCAIAAIVSRWYNSQFVLPANATVHSLRAGYDGVCGRILKKTKVLATIFFFLCSWFVLSNVSRTQINFN